MICDTLFQTINKILLTSLFLTLVLHMMQYASTNNTKQFKLMQDWTYFSGGYIRS